MKTSRVVAWAVQLGCVAMFLCSAWFAKQARTDRNEAAEFVNNASSWVAISQGNADKSAEYSRQTTIAAESSFEFAHTAFLRKEEAKKYAIQAGEYVVASKEFARLSEELTFLADTAKVSANTSAACSSVSAAEAQDALRQAQELTKHKWHAVPRSMTDPVLRLYAELVVKNSPALRRFVGSGVVLPGKKQILTAAHMVEDEAGNKMSVFAELRQAKLNPYTEIPLKVVAYDKRLDLAVLESDTAFEYEAIFDFTSTVEENGPLFVIGCPSGYNVAANLGYLSKDAAHDPLLLRTGLTWMDANNVWESSNAAAGGNSGGPVYSVTTGKVVGILVGGTDAPNFSIFVPLVKGKAWLDKVLYSKE